MIFHDFTSNVYRIFVVLLHLTGYRCLSTSLFTTNFSQHAVAFGYRFWCWFECDTFFPITFLLLLCALFLCPPEYFFQAKMRKTFISPTKCLYDSDTQPKSKLQWPNVPHLFTVVLLFSICPHESCAFYLFIVNGLGAPGVIPPFALGLGTPLTTSAYGNAMPSLGAFTLATTTGMGQANQPSLRGISNVLLVSNLNEEVSVQFCTNTHTHTHTINIHDKEKEPHIHCTIYISPIYV